MTTKIVLTGLPEWPVRRIFVVHYKTNWRKESVMAKQQTFGDKLGKKKGSTKISVKVIRGYKSEETGTVKFKERFVQVDDLGQIEKMEI